MISVEGQYVATFKIGSYSDFITPRNLEIFRIIEEAGNLMPIYELVFECNDENLVSVLREGNFIYASFGRTQNSMVNVKLAILKREKTNYGLGSQVIRVLGVLGVPQYRFNSTVGTYTGDSISVMKTIAGKYFTVKSDVTSPSNSMTWAQPNTNDRDFVNQLWLRTDLKGDIPIIGITTDGIFRIRSVGTAVDRNNPDWKLTSLESRDSNVIYYDDPPVIYSDSGAANALGGYAKSRIVHDLGDNKSLYSTPHSSPILSITSNQELSEMGRRLGGVSVMNDNVHFSYYSAYDYNVRNLLRLSMMKAKVQISNLYFGIRVLDSVLLKEDSDPQRTQSNIDSSGMWLTNKVCRILTAKDTCTIVTLCRDGMNSAREV